MRHLLTIFAALLLCAAPAQAQTLKALSYNTNGIVIYSSTNTLTFTNAFKFGDDLLLSNNIFYWGTDARWSPEDNLFSSALQFDSTNIAATTRANLGFSTNLNTLWTATNASNARSAVGLAATNDVIFRSVGTDSFRSFEESTEFYGPIFIAESGDQDIFAFEIPSVDRSKALGNLGIGASNIVTFAGLTNNGDVRINQTTASNGLLYIYRTNNEPFLGLVNLIASNNTTVSNETLFRVGVAEATNRSAQFGFRSTNTNGNGVAVFSVFGFDALMQIGADASTNAVIYSGGGTNNEVMTLIRDGATEFARPLRFSTNASTRPSTNAPANTTNVAAWVEMRIGTNSYRVPLYQ